MSIKATIGGFLAAGTLLISGVAGAAVIAPPPADINAWNAIVGPPAKTFVDTFDFDSSWTLVAFSPGLGATGLSVTEQEIGGKDTYTIAFDFTKLNGGLVAGTNLFLDYSMSLTGPEVFIAASIDTTCPADTPNCTVTKEVTGGTNNTTLISLGGLPDGPNGLSGQLANIHETFVVGENGLLTNATNTFTVATPEPMSLFLLGIGLAVLGFARRRSAA